MTEDLILGFDPGTPVTRFMIHEVGPVSYGLSPREAAYHGKPSFVKEYHVRGTSGSGRKVWHSFNTYKRVASRSSGTATVRTPVIPEWYNLGWSLQQWEGEFPNIDSLVDASGTVSGDGANSSLPPMYSFDVTGELVIPEPPALDMLLHNALLGMMPGIKANLSLFNSIYELKDFAHLGSSVSHILDTMRRLNLYRSVKGILLQDYAKQLTMREMSRRAGDTYLQYMFNFRPLYSDIKGCIKSMMSYRRELSRLIANAEKLQRRHYVSTVSPLGEDTTFESGDKVCEGLGSFEGSSFFSPSFTYSVRQNTVYATPKFHVEIQYSYSLPEFALRHAEVNALLDSLGINNNLGIIWAAIPWSFVVDWFVKVQAYLNRNRERFMEPVVLIRRALWSVEHERTTSSSVSIQGSGGHPASVVKETAYSRRLFQPTSDSIQSSGLTATQFSLAAALVFSRRPRH